MLTALDELLRRIEFGLPVAALRLTALPVGLSRGQYLALFAAGCRNLDDVNALDLNVLTECVGGGGAA